MNEFDEFRAWKAERDAEATAAAQGRAALVARIGSTHEAWRAARQAEQEKVARHGRAVQREMQALSAARAAAGETKRLPTGERLAHLPQLPAKAPDNSAAVALAASQAQALQRLRDIGAATVPKPPAPAADTTADRATMRAADAAAHAARAAAQERREAALLAEREAEREAVAARQAKAQRAVQECAERTAPPPPPPPAPPPPPPRKKPLPSLTERQRELLQRLRAHGRPVMPGDLMASEDELRILCWLGVARPTAVGSGDYRTTAFLAVDGFKWED